MAIEIESGQSPYAARPSKKIETNAHEIARLAAASKRAPGTRQTARALASRNTAIKYKIAASKQGSE